MIPLRSRFAREVQMEIPLHCDNLFAHARLQEEGEKRVMPSGCCSQLYFLAFLLTYLLAHLLTYLLAYLLTRLLTCVLT